MEPNTERGSLVLDLKKFSYEGSQVPTLSNLKLHIKKGEIIGLMGRTGSGKTSTLMLLNGLIPHFFEGEFEGEVISNTMNTQRYRVQTLARFTGLVLQDPETQIFGITVEKDVAFGPSNLAYDRDEIKNRVDNSIDAVGLSGYHNRVATQLSGGEKQRVAIAGILAMNPEILVLDEPTSELDPKGKKEIYGLLHKIRQKSDVTIIISGHDSEEMLQFVDRLVVLDEGKIAWQGEPKDLFKDVPLSEKLGIRPPEITEIGYHLIKEGLLDNSPIYSIDECVSVLSKRLNGKSVQQSDSIKVEPDTPVVIEAENVSYKYDNSKHALKNVNLKIHKGEFIALIGRNGAGKTTFSKHLNGLLRPSYGKIFINGKDNSKLTISQLSREVGYVFQNPDHQIFAASVKDEIEYGLKTQGIDKDETEKRVKDALAFVGLENFENRHPFSLGKGERQKLAVSSILAMSPEILVIDEPTTGQDWEGTCKMMKLLKDLHQNGHTILAITHDMRIAAEYADRIIVFLNGELVLDGTPSKVFQQTEILEKCFVTPPDSALLAQRLSKYGVPEELVTVNQLVENLKAKMN